jgi:hypothetical protein
MLWQAGWGGWQAGRGKFKEEGEDMTSRLGRRRKRRGKNLVDKATRQYTDFKNLEFVTFFWAKFIANLFYHLFFNC